MQWQHKIKWYTKLSS